jgi:hypothetical protein
LTRSFASRFYFRFALQYYTNYIGQLIGDFPCKGERQDFQVKTKTGD